MGARPSRRGLIGASAGVPPPGIYMFNQIFTYQANLNGPGVNTLLGGNKKFGVQVANDDQGFLFVPAGRFWGRPMMPCSCNPSYRPA